MSGYKWDPVIRVIPVNGGETIYWLSDRLTDVGGHVRIGLRYPVSSNIREDINRSLRPVVYGIRPEVDIDCVIWSMADQQFLSEIESALLDTRYYNVFLSLDGGCVYRQVVLADVSNAEPISGKTVVGARFTLRLRCVDMIARKPRMMADPLVAREQVPDGGFEVWDSGTVPRAWSVGGVCTVAQETTIKQSGASSAKVTRSDGSSAGQITQRYNGTFNVRPGCWYRHTISARGTSTMAATATGPLRSQILNSTRNETINTDGKSIGTASDNVFTPLGVLSGSFVTATTYFRIPSTWLETDIKFVKLSGVWTGGESLYYDDVSVYGPVLRPGVSTW